MSERLFIRSGIKEFDDLLTRQLPGPESGIAIPTKGGASSSIIAIKGPVGVGKSILASILALNIHCRPTAYQDIRRGGPRPTTSGKRHFVPFVVYFSYSQNARGIYHYLDDIVPEESSCGRIYPLILTPRAFDGQENGMELLEKFLETHLRKFNQSPFPEFEPSAEDCPWGTASRYLKEYLLELSAGDLWEFPPQEVIPESLGLPKSDCLDVRPMVFVDPINFFFDDKKKSRLVVAKLLHTIRQRLWPMIVTIEDAGSNASEVHRELMSYVEFEADTVIDLAIDSTPYIRHTIAIRKNRNSQPRFGRQQYRIERPKHSLWNIPSEWRTRHPGFLILPSIHWFLSHARERYHCRKPYYSGMSKFDEILRDPAIAVSGVARAGLDGLAGSSTSQAPSLSVQTHSDNAPAASLPPDSVVLIRGHKGGHKLSLGFNLLVAGLWNQREDEYSDESEQRRLIARATDKVLLLSLGEEIGLGIPRIALCRSLTDHEQCNNGDLIKFQEGDFRERPEQRQHAGFKIVIREWKARLLRGDGSGTPVLVEATFKPGNLSPEEFLWVVESLVKHYSPSRVMVENTAHLRMRFPELHREEMLFPALASLTQSQQIMLIVTDVLGPGSDEQLSYGLAASADFVVEIGSLDNKAFLVRDDYRDCFRLLNEALERPTDGQSPTWSRLTVSNVRGKNYRRGHYAVTVLQQEHSNSLVLLDVSRFFEQGRIEPLRMDVLKDVN